jgi:hypothetical protein
MRYIFVLVGLDVGFALFVTAHLAIVYGLAFRLSFWRAVLALVVAPLAPYWAARNGMRVRAGVWLASVALYTVAYIMGVTWAG